jgi:cell division protease FtsH
VDREVRRIVDECYRAAFERLSEQRERLERLARALLERETLDEEDAYRAAGFDRRPDALDRGGTPELDGVQAADVTPADA